MKVIILRCRKLVKQCKVNTIITKTQVYKMIHYMKTQFKLKQSIIKRCSTRLQLYQNMSKCHSYCRNNYNHLSQQQYKLFHLLKRIEKRLINLIAKNNQVYYLLQTLITSNVKYQIGLLITLNLNLIQTSNLLCLIIRIIYLRYPKHNKTSILRVKSIKRNTTIH